MSELLIGPISPDYQQMLDRGDVSGYAAALCEDGPRWWFEMDTLTIFAHLRPLMAAAGSSEVPPRLQLLSLAINPATPIEMLDELYLGLRLGGDLEAAAMCAGAGVANIWDSGAKYSRYQVWYERLGELLAGGHDISPLMAASMHGFRGLVEMTGHGSPLVAEKSYRDMSRQAEEAGSASLRLFFAAAVAYSLLWQGRLTEAEVLLNDVAPLCALPETSGVCKIYYQATLGLTRTVCGDAQTGRAVLEKIVDLPFFPELPPPVFYLGYGHLLHAMADSSTEAEIDRIADKIRQRAVPEQNHFHHSYLHFNLGIAYLGTAASQKAHVHSKEAIRMGELSESPISVNMPSFLYGQSLVDLNRLDEARGHFLGWLEKWAETGYLLLAAAGALELSAIAARLGHMDDARKFHDRAAAYMPHGEGLPCLFRGNDFLTELSGTLFSGDKGGGGEIVIGNAAVQITSFGSLTVKIGERRVYDRGWRGRGVRKLLAAVIVHGGEKVAVERLTDLLWPDCDGDRAYSNLKMALSRLRRVGRIKGEAALPWLVMKQRRISLVRSLCRVDSLLFQENLARARQAADPLPFLRTAIAQYQGDFLEDAEEGWIINHRNFLRREYVRAVTECVKLRISRGEEAGCLSCLATALRRENLNEELYALMMKVNMKLGYPAKALQVFRLAEKTLLQELGARPGPVLRALALEAGEA